MLTGSALEVEAPVFLGHHDGRFAVRRSNRGCTGRRPESRPAELPVSGIDRRQATVAAALGVVGHPWRARVHATAPRAAGLMPTSKVSTTLRVAGSITDTVCPNDWGRRRPARARRRRPALIGRLADFAVQVVAVDYRRHSRPRSAPRARPAAMRVGRVLGCEIRQPIPASQQGARSRRALRIYFATGLSPSGVCRPDARRTSRSVGGFPCARRIAATDFPDDRIDAKLAEDGRAGPARVAGDPAGQPGAGGGGSRSRRTRERD